MQSQLSPPATGSRSGSVSGGVSPLSPHSPLSTALRARANRASTRRHPAPLEPLSFAKIALDATSNPSSAVPSTDSDWPSDHDTDHRFLSRSPSLLTSLIRSQSRLASCSSSPVKPISELPPATPGAARPILRRGSATSETESHAEASGSPTGLRHRRSCLKFAVTPRPLQLQGCSSRRPSSPFRPLDWPALQRTSRPESDEEDESGDGNEDENDDENEEDEEEYEYEHEIYTPGLGSDFGSSDSDAGYREDSEDGFTSDEALSVSPSRWRPHLTQWTAPPAPILSRSPRRPSAFDCPSTTDDGEPGAARARTRTRIRIHDDGRERHRRKPTRHRSPPPQRSSIEGARPAPPAARSPSAAELCRRRSGMARSPCPPKMIRGWRSEDGRAPKPEGANPDALALALALVPEAPRARADSSCVKFAPGEAALAELREGRERERRRRPSKKALVRCHSAGAGAPPSAFRLARRDSAPAKIDEVHVLTSAEAGACPRRGLKHVLRRQVA